MCNNSGEKRQVVIIGGESSGEIQKLVQVLAVRGIVVDANLIGMDFSEIEARAALALDGEILGYAFEKLSVGAEEVVEEFNKLSGFFRKPIKIHADILNSLNMREEFISDEVTRIEKHQPKGPQLRQPKNRNLRLN